ncbi:molybdopterin-guanine dinucleotide biosynthesis protein B [Mesobacillus subterraneus]|uniref:Molybdopterin-guanine dinucleotide biosynthesis protein B n=1 Tax=Mesobacillus subterraneus TaxID=285983 RepID=A0A3R9FLZ7_9BACI|nr:molybdopterin-guanine dinucleotide biosynthesis protein B [Mesobacillus subterraneus]
MVKPVLFQIAGYQNSGKTTLVTTLIEHLSATGLKIATVKHHGHGGKPDILESKDSGRHIKAGAAVSLVEGGGRIIIQAENGLWTLAEEIEILSSFKTDLILIEGYKNEPYPKAVILRDEADLELLERLQHTKVIFCRDQELVNQLQHLDLPVFNTDDPNGLKWITAYIENQNR